MHTNVINTNRFYYNDKVRQNKCDDTVIQFEL